MASYKSQYPPSRRVEDRGPTTRLPQRSITPTTGPSQLPASSHSKLQKRRPSRDDEVQPRGPVSQTGSVSTSSIRQRTTSRSTPMFPQNTNATSSKPTSQTSTSRLPKLEVPQSIRTPSLASGSSASTIESPRSNVLRRKQASFGVASGRQAIRIRDDSMSSQDDAQPMEGIPGGYKDPFSETVLGISIPPTSTILARSEPQAELYNSPLYDDEIGPTDILPLPVPQYALSATPSTRYSESPGPFSVSSTPTSMSSYSPGTTLSRASNRTRQASPLQSRPPVTRHKTPDEMNNRHPHALSTVRESSTSSSSVSTVITESAKYKDMSSPNALATLPQSPRTSEVMQNTSERPQAQAPPEFAHLANQSPVPMLSARRPSRPSRDGTPELSGLRGPSPIIQSNMPHFPSHHKRSASSESRIALASTMRSKTTTPAKPSSRLPSPNPSSALPPATRSTSRGPTPDLQLDRTTRRVSSGPVPAPAPSPNKTSRFGFFTRRTKTEPAAPAKSDGKLHRRGPAAGTGHEGYGRYAGRGRSGSSISTNSIGRSASAGTTNESLDKTPSTRKSSMTSTTSGDMDDFFLNRLAPVVIRGTGSSTELSRSPEPMQSSSSLDVSIKQPTKTTQIEGSMSQSALEKNKPTLLPSAMPNTMRGVSPMKKMAMGLRKPSESDDDAKKPSLPDANSKRTSRALQNTQVSSGSLGSGSRIVGRIRKNSISGAPTETKEGTWLKSSKKNKAEKEASKPSKRWNFFQRAHAGPRADTPAGHAASPSNTVSASRSVAHYALMDQSGLELNDIEQLMQEADEGTESALSDDEPGRKERMLSMLLPPKPILEPSFVSTARPASPKVFLRPEAPPQPEQQQSKLFIDTNVPASYNPERYSLADLTPVTDLSRPTSPFEQPFPVQDYGVAPSQDAALALQPSEPEPQIPNSPPSQEAHVRPQDISSPGLPPANPPPRPSRLAQVGRIPQVVSTRRQPGRPSSRSFSRPFVPNQPRPAALPRTSFDSISPVVATAGPVEPYPILQGLSALAHGSAIAAMSPEEDEANRRSEFFKFPPRKDSEVSYSSSSGIWSFAPAASTAVVPSPGAPLSEDELWNEYDDLIDEVLSPVTSHAAEHRNTLRSHPSLEPMPLRPKAPVNVPDSERDDDEVTNPSLHLRRSRLLAVLHSNQSPASSVSFSEFISDYGERKISVIDPVTGRLSLPASPRLSTGSATKRSTRSSLPASLSHNVRQSRCTIASQSSKDRTSAATSRYRDSQLMDIAENQADGLLSMANLRFGALMISKWLSFGRVLFSPIHFELKNPKEDRVLVIDGLGKDWSYYCALTYPEATVYDMGPDPSPTTSSEGAAEAWSTLGNHRHICHPSLSKAFPFPMHFFACVVLRFPTALPSSEHHFVLSEAKRVLRPGGYLEFNVLDMDLVNMGNRARRAVRGLKMRMQVADENISLRNISDEVMAGIGRKGFVECNRCVVGVPVAGKLPNLEDMKAPATMRKDSTVSSTTKTSNNMASPDGPKPGVSFSDLLNASSASESTNNDITDMVARVGRWWYSRCYESLVLPEAGAPGAAASGTMLENSIWRDESLISECEKRGTSFKLLIGYAQKPEMGVRRTVSV
ncbi:hypothetical protein COCSADRAFT_198753 [Bipolaris sorokiniana ND90Pr]|uniref:Methyltransferase type 11 domain-containing protein n=1 Tax=Cochliobolus sativus (strain ND90Pr / ATCC 201652) TaxID=665912 RepID=M2T9H5_COCSN|nr:uncharacterized protein COCSADRAFT_198753 [Bipolaris sorokiniana ND90Pr]EMD65901.1 hypothetical protein COCSADRAFT_198753 [Bipolaris sorokiniana ND90Pr]